MTQESANAAAMTAWVDMLSMIGHKNSQLYDLVRHSPGRRSQGRAVLRELERERSRIARELHAGAGQPLAGIKLNLELLDQCFDDMPPRGREALERVRKLADQALEQVRAVSHSLHPPAWQDLTAAEAIRRLIESSGLETSMAVQAEIEPLAAEPPHSSKIALYRCAQECIANIIRHSGATRVRISLKTRGSMLELRIEDNGHGFGKTAHGNGIGLDALHEHANALDGSCEISSGPTGTIVVIQLPLTED